jgi:hypothetical protein
MERDRARGIAQPERLARPRDDGRIDTRETIARHEAGINRRGTVPQ